MSDPFVAEVKIFAGNFAPRGWALCNGQLLPIAQNTALFSLVGTTYGGDGRTTLGLPNLQGRAPMHPGRGPGLTPRTLGETDGSPTATVSESQLPKHGHTLKIKVSTAPATSTTPTPTTVLARSRGALAYAAAENLVEMKNGALDSTGGGNAHNNMQPFLVMNFIIALTGTYPSRS